ncbi:MAG: hypothetical protein M2R45_02363 [Verrucomicrobia subdivision 3 bacterium]|nr:hypothetical protein [Limisphaerales bacterium]MCS1414914.1 hypothetical protein [Limisphaerales bacterium]
MGCLPRTPIASPFHGGTRAEDYQLVLLLKAPAHAARQPADHRRRGAWQDLRRAGFILTEPLLLQRIRRVLVLAAGIAAL